MYRPTLGCKCACSAITRASRARHGGAASLRGGRQVPQRGCGRSRIAVPPFHPNSYSARKRADVRLFTTRSDPCGGRARTKRGARWLKPSYVMSPCDFQKDSMSEHTFVWASNTIRVVAHPGHGILTPASGYRLTLRM